MQVTGASRTPRGRGWWPGSLRQAPVAWGWAGGVVAIQALVAHAGGPAMLEGWFVHLGLSRAGFLSGEIWQILSYGMLHGSWWHAGINACFVLVIGARVERRLGSAALACATLAGVAGGGACHLVAGRGLLVGLSGGCLALLLVLTTLSPQSRMWPLPVSGKNLGLGMLLAALTFALIDPALGLPAMGTLGRWLAGHGLAAWFQVGHACHFGGALAGWWYARGWLRWRARPSSHSGLRD